MPRFPSVLARDLPRVLLTVWLAGVAFQTIDEAAERTVWDGVYSAPQAERGKVTFLDNCARCHGPDLEGTTSPSPAIVGGVALSGDVFKKNWYAATVHDLFEKISKTMPAQPATKTGTLTEAEVLDLVAFILSRNEFPAGAADLRYGADLAVVDIVGKDGPDPVATGQTARAIGCLAAGAAPNVWLLSRSTPPVKAKNTGASAGLVLERANATALGTHSIRLLNARPEPGTPPGAKVEVKGRYVKVGDEDRISVLSFQMLSASCS